MSASWSYNDAMSDGPHRTLNMRRPWKALAERADGAAYSHAEVVAYVAPAVSSDWNNEVTSAYLNEIGQYLGCGQQTHLFEKDPAEIDRLRQKASSPMEAVFAEYAKDTSLRGDEALHDVVKKTMRECAVRRTLQAQEHYLRKSSHLRAAHMKGRMQAAVITASTGIFGAMAQSVVTGARMSIRPPAKRGGLDDGPALP
jgi:hypothetical protein